MTERLFCNLAVLARELRTRMRGRRAAVVITVYLLLLSTLGGMMLYSQMQDWRSGLDPVSAASVGQLLFGTLSQVQLFLVIFIVPGLTGSAIAGERDRQTWELLLSTQVSALWIVLGKLLASLSYVFLLMLASLPLFSLVFLFGGVSPDQVALAFLISMVSALTLGAIGVFLSVVIRRGPTATVIAYAVTFVLLIGTLLLTIFLGVTTNRSVDDSPLLVLPLALNPLAALASATLASNFDGIPLLGPPASGTGDWLALWHISMVVDAALFCVFLSLAALMLRPGVSWPARFRLFGPAAGRR